MSFQPDSRFEASRQCRVCGGVDDHEPDCPTLYDDRRAPRVVAWVILAGIVLSLLWQGGLGSFAAVLALVAVACVVATRRLVRSARRR